MNIVVIDIDSLRPWNMGCYGYSENTTPNIDELAEESVVFENAYAAGSPSMPSRAAFLTGRYPVSNGIETHGEQGQVLNDPLYWKFGRKSEWEGDLKNWWTLPEMLFHNRLKTCAISSFGRQPAPWFYRLWHEYYQPQEPEGEMKNFSAPRADEVASAAIDFIEREDEKFFLYTQFWDPHVPYNRPEQEAECFDGELPPYPEDSQIEEHEGVETWRSPQDAGIKNREGLEYLMAKYNAEIRHVDEKVGEILEKLREEEIYEETLLIVMADHSEEFGEHGFYQEHGNVYETTQRIPLIIKTSGENTGRNSDLVTNVDLAPTIADYSGMQKPGKWQGKSLRPLIEQKEVEWRNKVVLDHGLYTVQRAIRKNNWKMVKTFHSGFWKIPGKQLFDLEEDQWEQNDISGSHPDKVEELESEMEEWVEQHLELEEDPLKQLADSGGAGYRFNKYRFENAGDKRS